MHLSLHDAERTGHLSHATWADGIVLACEKPRNLRAWEISYTPLHSAPGSDLHAKSFASDSPED